MSQETKIHHLLLLILDASPKDRARCVLVAHSPTGVLKYEIYLKISFLKISIIKNKWLFKKNLPKLPTFRWRFSFASFHFKSFFQSPQQSTCNIFHWGQNWKRVKIKVKILLKLEVFFSFSHQCGKMKNMAKSTGISMAIAKLWCP